MATTAEESLGQKSDTVSKAIALVIVNIFSPEVGERYQVKGSLRLQRSEGIQFKRSKTLTPATVALLDRM